MASWDSCVERHLCQSLRVISSLNSGGWEVSNSGEVELNTILKNTPLLQFTHLTKGWYPEFTKNKNRFTRKKQTSPFKTGQRIWTDTLQKTYVRPTNIWKNAHHHWSLEKCKSKPHWDTISRQLEWQSLKNLEITDAEEDVEKKEHFYTVGRSVN